MNERNDLMEDRGNYERAFEDKVSTLVTKYLNQDC